MSRSFYDYAQAEVGKFPSGHLDRWNRGRFKISLQGGVNKLEGSTTSFTRCAASLDDGGVSKDTEVFSVLSFTDAATYAGVTLRAGGDALKREGYIAYFRPGNNRVDVVKATGQDTVETTLGSINLPISLSVDYAVRLRAEGSNVSCKAWLYSDPEPAAWGFTVADASWTIGWCGVFSRANGGLSYMRSLGVGTEGDAAPKASIAKAPPVYFTDGESVRRVSFNNEWLRGAYLVAMNNNWFPPEQLP